MRIIAGKFRRRQLLTNPGTKTRPITDRVKETLFERLSGHVEQRRVADVFAGTGTLGLEALSRGARTVVFVESDRKAFDLLQQNVAKLGVQDETLCWRADVFRCSFHPKGVPDLMPYDLIFFDPPYRLVRDLKSGSPLYRALERLARPAVSDEQALLVLRTPEHADFELPPCWRADRRLDISTMEIHLYELDRSDGSSTVSESELGST